MPKRLAIAVESRNALRYSASVVRGMTRLRRSIASSFTTPVGRCVRGSRTIPGMAGPEPSGSTPAIASARELAQAV